MAVGFKVAFFCYQIGNGDFLHSFFSTVSYNLDLKNHLRDATNTKDTASDAWEKTKDAAEDVKAEVRKATN